MARTLTKWTVEEYHYMIKVGILAGRQVELLDGQIIDMEYLAGKVTPLAFPEVEIEVERLLPTR